MANSGYINVAGDRLILTIDPSVEQIADPCSIDLAKLEDIAITASGGAVTATAVRIRQKYPRAVADQFIVRLKLSRKIKFGETATVDVPASLMFDGTDNTHDAVSSLSITNRSYWHESISELIDDDTPIVFIDPDSGNDTGDNAGVAYTRTNVLVGSDPENPAGSVLPFRTLKKAMDIARGSTDYTSPGSVYTHFVALVKRGTTIDGSSDRVATFSIISGVRGESLAKPAIFGTYGSGDLAVLAPSGVQNSLRAQGNEEFIIVSRGLDLRQGDDASAVYWRARDGENLQNYLFVCSKIASISMTKNTSTPIFTGEGYGFINCVLGEMDGICFGAAPPGPTRHWYDLNTRSCLFTDIGTGSLEHPAYIKNGEDWDAEGNYTYDTAGAARKFDGWHGIHESEYVTCVSQVGFNVECNGGTNTNFGVQTDRTESTGGNFSEHVTIENGVISDAQTGRGANSFEGIDLACSSDVEITNNLIVLTSSSGTGILYRSRAGANDVPAGARDGFRWSVHHNTIVGANHNAARFNVPDSDDFALNTTAKGWHDCQFYANTIYGLTGNTRELFSFQGEDYAVATAIVSSVSPEGRCSGTWTNNNIYHEDGETGVYGADNGTSLVSYDTAAALISAVGSDVSNLRFEDPAPEDPTYTVEDYVTSVAGGSYADLAAAFAAIETGILAESIPATLTVSAINAAMIAKHIQTGLSSSDYGGYTPGITDWTAEDAPAGTGPDIRVDGVPNGVDYTFGQRNISETDLSVSLDLINIGDATGTFGLIAATGDASITSAPADNATLAADASATLTVALDRSVGGPRLGTVTIPVDGEPDYVITFSCDVLAPFGELTDGANVTAEESVVVEASKDSVIYVTFRLRNTGDATMTGIDITLDTGLTLQGSAPLTLAPGSNADITLLVDTSSFVTAESRTVTVEYDFGDPLEIEYIVTVAGAELELLDNEGGAADLSADLSVAHNQPLEVTYRLLNDTDFAATGLDIQASGLAAVEGTIPTTLAAGDTLEFTVSFDTSTYGPDQAAGLTIDYDGGDQIEVVYAVDVTTQIQSVGLYDIRRVMQGPVGHTPIINISDSNGEQGRWHGAVRLAFDVTHKYIQISPNTGFTGAAAGTSTVYTDVGGAAHDGANFVPGDSILGTSGLLTGLSSSRYEYPVRGLKSQFTSDPTTPHFSRLLTQGMTHGTTMQNGDGTTPATYAGGDPTTGDAIRFGFACLGNTNGNTWSEELATDVDPQGDSTWQDTVTAGYSTDATVAATDLGIVVYERATPIVQSAVGMSGRIKHTSTDEATDRTGRQVYILDTWMENTEVDDGLSFWTWSIGGWNTTDHMPPVVNGNANSDAKWDTDRAIEWVQKVARSTSGYIIFRIQLGQNDVGAGGNFGEGSGTNIENYPLNIEAIVSRCRVIADGAGLIPLIYLVAPQNTISGGARFLTIASALRELAVSTNIGFFDLRGALIDNGYADTNYIMDVAISSDSIHAGQLGTEVFGTLEWSAISTAVQENLGRSLDRGRTR